jgi:hypothetical protein
MLSKRIPLHFLASQIYGMLSCRAYLMALAKYASNFERVMPERLRQPLMSYGVLLLEHSRAIETTPAMSTWAWYIGAIHSYHSALMLLSEMYAAPREKEIEARIWESLDWAFELPKGLTNGQKSGIVLKELAKLTELFLKRRRIRAPATMKHAGPRVHGHEFKRRAREEADNRDPSDIDDDERDEIKASNANLSQDYVPGFSYTQGLPDIDFSLTATDGSTDSGGIASSNFNNYTSSLGNLAASPAHGRGSDTSSSANLGGLGGQGNNNAGSSPADMSGMPEIDWVSGVCYQ